MSGPASNLYRQVVRVLHRTQGPCYRRAPIRSYAPPTSRFISSSAPRYVPNDEGSSEEDKKEDHNGETRQKDGESDSPARDLSLESDNASALETPHFNEAFYKDITADEKRLYLSASPTDRRNYERHHAQVIRDLGPGSNLAQDLDALVEKYKAETEKELGKRLKPPSAQQTRYDDFFSSDGDPDIAPDEEFKGDDISSTAHGELDQHREMREYMRLASWEMPLLANLVMPFKPPNVQQTPFRWRYTTYMGVPHPAASKVVLTFCPNDLQLTPRERAKFIKLLGVRYDPHTGQVKMSCESFPSQAQNKRYLGDTVGKLVEEAKRLDVDGADSLEDLPFDFRHASRRPKARFPPRWRIYPARLKRLQRARAATVAELTGSPASEVVDGVEAIERARLGNGEVHAKKGPARLDGVAGDALDEFLVETGVVKGNGSEKLA